MPKPFNGVVGVYWLNTKAGTCHGKEYYDATPACRAALLAQARQLALKGVVGKVPENGHALHGEYDGLHVLKPGDHRFMYFRWGDSCYITNGAPKKTNAKQNSDYGQALKLMKEFKSRERKR